MSEYTVPPGPIASDTFHTYRSNWDAIIADLSSDNLRACFASGNTRMNYVFMETGPITSLINTAHTTQIQAVFVSPSLDAPHFTVVLVPLDDDGFPTSSTYYLAGVANFPAKIGPPPPPPITAYIPVPNNEVYPWIEAWHNLAYDSLNLENFQSAPDAYHRTLRGYTYTKKDFTDALAQVTDVAQEGLALWLNFALYKDVPEQFAMTLCLNKMPVDNTPSPEFSGEIDFTSSQHYFDLSRPCPPYCSVFIPVPSQA